MANEIVTAFCHTWFRVGIGTCEGRLIEHGNRRLSFAASGPFVRLQVPRKRNPRLLVATGGTPYFVLLAGGGYPDPGLAFPLPAREREHECVLAARRQRREV